MDFFAAQDLARRNSRLLILWFVLAVAGIIATVYVALAVAMTMGAENFETGQPTLWDPQLFIATAAAVGGLILLGSAYKTMALARNGGAAIAEELGGRRVSRSSSDPLERRLINVVDEMAIASGIPAPPVYVLDAEQGINAFAAGSRTTDGIVAVTRGTLEKLSRDELQGVIAHEFSHILNGDMRLNLKLIGALHGILLLTLAGRVMMRSARGSDKGAAPMVLGGLALVVLGYIGVLFGKLIKAGVSRQREYLADAAAVQFTRNPAGIAGALKRIAGIGSEIHHPRAEEASHLFFGSSAHFSRLLATHPPIADRIRRLGASFDTDGSSPTRTATADTAVSPSAAEPGTGAAALADQSITAPPAAASTAAPSALSGAAGAFSPAAFTASVGHVRPEHVARVHALLDALPHAVGDAVHQTGGARAIVFALLLSPEAAIREQQLTDIEQRFGPAARDQSRQHAEWLHSHAPTVRLPLLDLALPTLAELSGEARVQVLEAVDRLIEADGRTSLFEYVLRRLLRGALQKASASPTASVSLKTLKTDTARLLGLMAQAGGTSAAAASAAFAAATAVAPLEGPWHMEAASTGISVKDLDRILTHLAATQAPFRKKLVEACATAVLHDNKVTATEAELLRAVCQALDCPAPPLLDETHSTSPPRFRLSPIES